MKRPMLILALAGALALIAMPAYAQSDTCVIYGTAYKPDGKTPIDGREMNAPRLSITRATKAGRLYGGTITVTPTPQGVYRFTATRTSSGDTSYIYIKGGLYGFEGGATYVVPDADSAHISSLIQQAAPPTVHVFRPVVTSTIKIKSPTDSASVPSILFTGTGVSTTFSGTSQATVTITAGGGTGDTTGTTNQPAFSRFENMLGQFTASTSDSLVLAHQRLGDRADADSLATVKTTADGAVQKADTNALHAQKFRVIDDRLGDRADADSLATVKSTADAALPRADTTALHAQRFRVIDDRLGDRADADSLASVRDTASVANRQAWTATTIASGKLSWSDTTGFFARYGGVTSESDPTASSRIDSALTQGVRSIGTAGRYTSGIDSLTLTALNDTIDVALGSVWIVSLTRNDTLYFRNWPTFPVTQAIEITVVQTGTYTLVFNGVRWSGGTAPTITASANKIDQVYIANRKGYVLGFPAVQNF